MAKERGSKTKERQKRSATITPGAAFLALRTELALTRAQFARLVGCSDRSLANWESGAVEPNESALRLLQQLQRLRAAAARLMKPGLVSRWLLLPNEAFQGMKPIELIERGEVDRLWSALAAAESGMPI